MQPNNCSTFVKRRLDSIQGLHPDIKFVAGKLKILLDYLSRSVSTPETTMTANTMVVNTLTMSENDWKDIHIGHGRIEGTYRKAQLLGVEISKQQVRQAMQGLHCKPAKHACCFT